MAISMLLFNYQYARQHGFVKWLVLGEVVPSLTATVWPYYLARGIMTAEKTKTRRSDTQEWLHTTGISRYYPALIDYVAQRGPLVVQWMSDGRNVESLEVSAGATGSIIIKTSIPVSTRPDGTAETQRLWVSMNDDDRDGTLDRITYTDSEGTSHSSDLIEDEGGRLLWDRCLALTFLYGEPFK
jgi:hypothetical protein